MEVPRLETGVAYHLHDLNLYNKFQEYQKEGKKPFNLQKNIPLRFDDANCTQQLISLDHYFSTSQKQLQKVLLCIKEYKRFYCDTRCHILEDLLVVTAKVASAIGPAAAVAYVDQSVRQGAAAGTQGGATYISVDPGFGQHVNSLRGTMFYVCQGSCLCGTVNNRGKVIYCYGDLVPRQGELFAEGEGASGTASSKDLLAAQLGIWTFGIFALLIVLILIRKSITSLRKHLQKVTERLPLYHDDDSSSLAPSATSPSITGAKPGDPAANAMAPPDLFSDEGTLTPDPDDPETDEMGGMGMGGSMGGIARMGPLSKATGPVSKLKTVRIGRKDFKKGGEALRGKNVTEAFRVKEKDVKRTMKCHLPNIDFNMSPSSSSIFGPGQGYNNNVNNREASTPETPKKQKHHHKRTRIKSIVTPRRMKRGTSEEPFLDHKENTACSSDSEDNKLDDKDVVKAAAKAQEEQEVYNKIIERRGDWNRNRRGTDDCQVSCRYPAPTGDLLSSTDEDILRSQKYTKMLTVTRAPLDKKHYNKAYSNDVQSEEDLVLTVVKFERDRKPKTFPEERTEVSKV